MMAMITRWKFFLNGFQSSEPPPTQHEEQHPGNTARDVVDGEPGVGHLADPGHERREGPDDGHEPGQDDRHAAVPLVKRVCLEQVFPVQKPGIFACKHLGAQVGADRVIDRIASDGGNDQEQANQSQVDW